MLRKLEGDVNFGRCGYCFIYIFDFCVFLFGGVCVLYRNLCVGLLLFINVINNGSVLYVWLWKFYWIELFVLGFYL